MQVAIIGGGIGGLALALGLHQRGIGCRVYEAAPEMRELGVGITILPHAMRELAALGLQQAIEASAIENREACFFNRFGQLLYREPRGLGAGYPYPEHGIHRGRLHLALYGAVIARLGAEAVRTGHRCCGIEQDADGARIRFQDSRSGEMLPEIRADVAIGGDGFGSAVRRHFYPDEKVAFAGINTWRGITRHAPILDGHSYVRIGSIRTGKLVVYPIIDNVDAQGNQLINWMAEIQSDTTVMNDWNKPGRLEDFLPIYQDWVFDWLNVPQMLRDADTLLEYPMVDREPVARWTFGRVSLLGDAAHPMYPRGSNGAAQALIDARTLAEALAAEPTAEAALSAYEAARIGPTAAVVRANRSVGPDIINIRVEELAGDRPIDRLEDHISQDELRALSDRYKQIAGFSLENVR